MRISDWSSDVCSSDLRNGVSKDLAQRWALRDGSSASSAPPQGERRGIRRVMQQPMPFQPTRRAFIGAALALGLPGTAMAATNAQRLVRAARRQVGVTLYYDPAYSVRSE